MSSKSRLVRATMIGAVTGLAILGMGGRIAMLAASWLLGLPVGLTFRGTVAVIVTGGIYGAVGGACLHLIGHKLPRTRWVRAVITGTALFLVVATVSTLNRQTGPAWQYPVRTLALFLPLAWAWAVSVLRLPTRESR